METIKNYLDAMFMKLPDSYEVQKAKKDLYAMMEDKYEELIKEGMAENEAVGTVISDFGNIDEIANDLGLKKGSDGKYHEPFENQYQNAQYQNQQYQNQQYSNQSYGGQTQQNDYRSKPRNDDEDDVYYENKYLNAVMDVYWQTVTCIYLIWSFLTFDWHITWIIWPIAAVAGKIIKNIWGIEKR